MLHKFLVILMGLSTFIYAGDINRKVISCEPSMVYKCTMQECEKIEVVNIDDEIQYFGIDLEKKTLVGKIGNATVDVENITSRHGNKNTFVFFGTHADSKFDWILRIDKKTNKMVLLATNVNLDGFTVYGTCNWEAEK